MKRLLGYKYYLIYLIPLFAACTARELFYMKWLQSPFRYYHTLVGLDMRKFLVWGEQLYNGDAPFSMYKFVVAMLYSLFGRSYLPEVIVLFQMFLGAITTILTVYVFRHLFRNKAGALIAGLLCGLYAPLIVYESHILKESLFLFLSFLSFAMFLAARRKHFSPIISFCAGAVGILPFFVRFSGLLLFLFLFSWIIIYCCRKKCLPASPLVFLMGSCVIVSVIFTYNISHGFSIIPYFTPNTPYLLGVGSTPDIQNLSFSVSDNNIAEVTSRSTIEYIITYVSKLGYIFTGYEQPNNINYYFTCSKLEFLKYYIGPFFLIPISVAGLILMLLNFKRDRRVILLCMYIISFIIPMLLFLPLARYKIALTPLFAILAAWWIVYIFHLIRSPRKQPLVVPLILYFSSFLVSGYICRNRIDRECDLKAYGIAASYLPDKLMSQGRYHQALKILEKYYMVNKKNPYIMLNYASSLMGTGQASKAGEVLFNCHYIQDQSLLGRYFYELGECAYMKCNFKGALKYYNTALQYPISERREEFAKARIRSISERDK